jgi:alpha-1,3-rhamnosyl/mannosyltransferase
VERPEFSLVIVGCKGFVTKTIEDLVSSLSLGPHVEITGWIPRSKVYEYFAGAFGLIHPSRFEGFGMPVLEALAAGLPTTCSGIEPLITIAGGSCLHFDPEDESAMLETIRRLSSDERLRRELVMNGLKVAQPYSWRRCAEETLDALLESVNGPRKAEAVVSRLRD